MNIEISTELGGRAFPDAQDGLPENANELASIALVEESFDGDDDETDSKEFKAIPIAQPGKELNTAIVSAAQNIVQLKADRALINTQIKEIIEGMEAKGILRDALKDTIRKMEWTEAKRESYALGCGLAGSALGIMEQTDLFSVN